MKNYVKPAAFAVAIILLTFSQSVKASVGPHVWYAALATHPLEGNNKFNVELIRLGTDEVICASIENPGRKNLSITLTGPDGATMDNFFTGRKFVKMSKHYNFTGAEEGMYTITISDGVERIKKQIKLERVVTAPVSNLILQ